MEKHHIESLKDMKIGGKKNKKFNAHQPPKKNRIKWIEEIIKWRYSAKKNINNIGPLYSVAYPETTSDSVSAWSKGALFDSKNNTTIKPTDDGANKIIYQYEYWFKTKSWKLEDWEAKTSNEYIIVTKISNEITWTKPLIVPSIAYRDWLSRPTIEKKIFDKITNIIW